MKSLLSHCSRLRPFSVVPVISSSSSSSSSTLSQTRRPHTVFGRRRSDSQPSAEPLKPSFHVPADDFTPRLQAHFERTLHPILVAMNYDHPRTLRPEADPQTQRRQRDPESPYSANGVALPRFGGGALVQKATRTDRPRDAIRLEKVVLHIFAGANAHGFHNATMILQAISGDIRETSPGKHGQEAGPSTIRAKKSVAQFDLKKGNRVGSVATLRGASMWQFIDILAEFVLPRVTNFKGLRLPPKDRTNTSHEFHTGVVEFLLPESSIQFFPQITPAFDSFTRSFGMYVQFVTNQSGPGATDKARMLLSGLRMPFHQSEPLAVKRQADAERRDRQRAERMSGNATKS